MQQTAQVPVSAAADAETLDRLEYISMTNRAVVFATASAVFGAAVLAIFRRTASIGSPNARRRFTRRNRAFLRALPRVRKLANAAIDRDLSSGSGADRLVHLLARRAVDDFEEIVVLAANGYGFGGLSLVRGMYERVVTSFHLHFNPEDADNFADYHWIQRWKLAKAIGSSIEKKLSEEVLESLEKNYGQIKDKYVTVVCHKCGAKDVNFRWHKLDFVAMAKKAGVEAIKDLLVRAYYIPLEHAHSTAGSLLFQLEEKDGKPVFKKEQDPMYADHAVAVAHLLVLLAIDAVRRQLNLPELQSEIDGCAKDHGKAWPNL